MDSKGKISAIFGLCLSLALVGLFIITTQAQSTTTKSYDGATRTATITQSGSMVAEIQLVSNSDQCLSECEATIRIRPGAQLTLPQSPNSDYKLDFVKALGAMDIRDYKFEKMSPYTVKDYSTFCNPYQDTRNNSVMASNCTEMESGSHTEYRYDPFPFWGQTLNATTDYYIRIIAKKEAKLGPNNIEWIPTFYGIEINEWAWWNSSWLSRRLLNVTNAQASDVLWLNLSGSGVICSNVNCTDVVVTNLSNDIVPFQIPLQNVTTKKPNNFLVLPLTAGREFYIYYNNTQATVTKGVNFTVWEDDFESYRGGLPIGPNATGWVTGGNQDFGVNTSEGQKALFNSTTNGHKWLAIGKLLTNWTVNVEWNHTASNAMFIAMEKTATTTDGYRMATMATTTSKSMYDNADTNFVCNQCITAAPDIGAHNWTFTRNGTTLIEYSHNQTTEKTSLEYSDGTTTSFYYLHFDRETPNYNAMYRLAVYDNTVIGSTFTARTYRGFSNYTIGSEEPNTPPAPPPEEQGVNVTECGVVLESNTHYILRNNITNVSVGEACFTSLGEKFNISINLNGFILTTYEIFGDFGYFDFNLFEIYGGVLNCANCLTTNSNGATSNIYIHDLEINQTGNGEPIFYGCGGSAAITNSLEIENVKIAQPESSIFCFISSHVEIKNVTAVCANNNTCEIGSFNMGVLNLQDFILDNYTIGSIGGSGYREILVKNTTIDARRSIASSTNFFTQTPVLITVNDNLGNPIDAIIEISDNQISDKISNPLRNPTSYILSSVKDGQSKEFLTRNITYYDYDSNLFFIPVSNYTITASAGHASQTKIYNFSTGSIEFNLTI